jgi:hypothetical protein
MASSVMMALLMNSEKVSLVLSVLLQLGGETIHEMVLFLLIGVNLLQSVLCQMVEQLRIVMHRPSALLQAHEPLMFFLHNVCRDVMGAKGITELDPQHLVVRRASGAVVGPPHACIF